MSKLIKFFSFVIIFHLLGCSGISVIKTGKTVYYRDFFLERMAEVKKIYAAGDVTKAIGLLEQMDNKSLLPAEIAKKRNLLGVIYFSQKDNDRAINYFEQALVTSSIDGVLTTQIYLNLASTYFVLEMYDKAYSQLILGQPQLLNVVEKRKYYSLMYETAKRRGIDRDVIYSLTNYLGTFNSLSEIKGQSEYEALRAYFSKFNLRQKLHFFDEFSEQKYLIVGYLAYLEADNLYYQGERDEAKDLVEWIQDKFDSEELLSLVSILQGKSSNKELINKKRIAVILPFTNKKKKFSKRVLMGLEFFLKQQHLDYELIIKDSRGSASVGAQMVEDAIVKDQVAVVIGGLFSNEAEQEYLMAKKRGALFISLAQVYLPSIQKDHTLIEIPGSIESQLDLLFSDKFLNAFGKRAVVLYPDTERGNYYANRFWEMAAKTGVEVKNLQTYKKGEHDFRVPVKRLLGLGYPRQRSEELDILKDIYSLEKRTSINRIQFLRPQVDFDWVFLPVSPKDAVQIVPSFRYYDAFRLKIIGTPGWRSRIMFKQSKKLGALYFLGADLNSNAVELEEAFKQQYNKRLGLIELNSLLAIRIAHEVLSSDQLGDNRMTFDLYLKAKDEFRFMEGSWRNSSGIWIKNMNLLSLRWGKSRKIDLDLVPSLEQQQKIKEEKEKEKVEAEAAVKETAA